VQASRIFIGSVTKPGNPAAHFRLARASNGKPAIAAPSRRRFDRERDELGRYLPSERSTDDASTDDLGG